MSPGHLRPIIIIAILLCISGLFSAAEMSFLAMGRRRSRRAATGRVAVVLEKLLASPGTTLGASRGSLRQKYPLSSIKPELRLTVEMGAQR